MHAQVHNSQTLVHTVAMHVYLPTGKPPVTLVEMLCPIAFSAVIVN